MDNPLGNSDNTAKFKNVLLLFMIFVLVVFIIINGFQFVFQCKYYCVRRRCFHKQSKIRYSSGSR